MNRANKITIYIGILILGFSLSSYADLSSLRKKLDTIKNEALKNESSEKNSASNEAPSKTLKVDEKNTLTKNNDVGVKEDKKTTASESSNYSSTDTAASFRAAWCKKVDTRTTGKINYRGVGVGDMCLAPDSFIVALKDRMSALKVPVEWFADPKSLTESLSYTISNFVYEDKKILKISIAIDPSSGKVYIGSFTGLLCAADPSNSLDNGNSFRIALETKYGPPSLIQTEYEVLNQQAKELEEVNNQARKKQITVAEAKQIRENESSIETFKQLAKRVDKNLVRTLGWDYEKPNKLRPVGMLQIAQIEWPLMRDVGGCPVKDSNNNDIGFAAQFLATQTMMNIFKESSKKEAKAIENKQKNAPAPEL